MTTTETIPRKTLVTLRPDERRRLDEAARRAQGRCGRLLRPRPGGSGHTLGLPRRGWSLVRDPVFSRFNAAVGVLPCRQQAIGDLRDEVRNSADLADAIATLRRSPADQQQTLKSQLDAVTFGGRFSYRDSGLIQNLTGYVIIDADHLSLHGAEPEELKALPARECGPSDVFVSPGATG